MFPYYKKKTRLHYFGDESILIQDNIQLFFNNAETMLLKKVDGKTTSIEIAKQIAKELSSNDYLQIHDLFLEFISKKYIVNILSFSNKPVHNNNCITSGKTGRKYPLNILLEITNKCNLKCTHCYKEAGYIKNDEIDTRLLLQKLSLLTEDVYDVQISGGEPMTHRNFEEIVTFVKENFQSSSITTAGTLISSKNIHLLKGLSNVQVSLYSANKEKHEQITLVPRSFEKTLSGIKLLVENNIYTTVSSIVTSDNLSELELLVEKVISVGAHELKFGEFSRSGRGVNLPNSWELDEQQNIQAEKIITNIRLKYQDKIIIADWEDDETTKKKMDYNHGGFSCGAGNLSWTITENGNIRPCVFLPEEKFSTGNIFDDSMEALLKKEHIKNLYKTLEQWEKELNTVELSTSKICPVMSNYLDAFKEYTSSK